MRVKDQVLLLKDLCGRLPYGVKCIANSDGYAGVISSIESLYGVATFDDGRQEEICDIKPYLFPLSSMTEEQKKEILKRYNYHDSYGLCIEITNHSEGYWEDDNPCHLQDYLWLVDWYNINHFDYRNLIGKNLAIDCTNLNIY